MFIQVYYNTKRLFFTYIVPLLSDLLHFADVIRRQVALEWGLGYDKDFPKIYIDTIKGAFAFLFQEFEHRDQAMEKYWKLFPTE